jgi:hypothetical protein
MATSVVATWVTTIARSLRKTPQKAHIPRLVFGALAVRFDEGHEADHGGEGYPEIRIEQAFGCD